MKAKISVRRCLITNADVAFELTTKKIDDMNDAVNRKLKTCFIDFVANL